MATTKLSETTEYMITNAQEVVKTPENLEELTNRIELWEKLNSTAADTHKQLPAIREKFAILEKYEVQVGDEVYSTLDGLQGEWNNYQAAISEADAMIKKSKDKFKSNLLANADEFKKSGTYVITMT